MYSPSRLAVVLAAALATVVLSAGHSAQPAHAAVDLALAPSHEFTCEIDSADLHWAFKDSFLAYLDSAIADGGWTTNGPTYADGTFSWYTSDGAFHDESPLGQVRFEGSIRFEGHDGELDTTIANPQVQFTTTGAYLVFDVTGVTQEGVSVNQPDVRFADLDLTGALVEHSAGTLTLAEIPAVLTQEGADAFGTYPAGEQLAPVTVGMSSEADCAGVLVGTALQPQEIVDPAPAGSPDSPDEPASLTWLWIIVAALAAGTVAVVVAIARRGQAG